MLEKLRGHVFVNLIRLRQLQRHREHRQAIKTHPGCAIRLLEKSARRERFGTVEDADVIQTEEAAGEEIIALRVLPIHPPGEIEHQLLEGALEKGAIALLPRAGDFINAPGRPRVDGRIDVAEGKLVGRDLAVRVHVPFAQKELELLLREVRIDFRKRHHVEGEIPSREPRILPLVRHRNNVAVEEMLPLVIAPGEALRRRRRLRRIALKPLPDDVVIKLLAPEETGISLAHDVARFAAGSVRRNRTVKLVRLRLPPGDDAIEKCERIGRRLASVREPQPNDSRLARRNFKHIMRREFRPRSRAIYCFLAAADDVLVKSVFHVTHPVVVIEEALCVRFVVREQRRRLAFVGQLVLTDHIMTRPRHALVLQPNRRLRRAFLRHFSPGPGVPKPKRRKQMKRRFLRAAIDERHPNEDVVLLMLGVFSEDIEVAIFLKNTGVAYFKLQRV